MSPTRHLPPALDSLPFTRASRAGWPPTTVYHHGHRVIHHRAPLRLRPCLAHCLSGVTCAALIAGTASFEVASTWDGSRWATRTPLVPSAREPPPSLTPDLVFLSVFSTFFRYNDQLSHVECRTTPPSLVRSLPDVRFRLDPKQILSKPGAQGHQHRADVEP